MCDQADIVAAKLDALHAAVWRCEEVANSYGKRIPGMPPGFSVWHDKQDAARACANMIRGEMIILKAAENARQLAALLAAQESPRGR